MKRKDNSPSQPANAQQEHIVTCIGQALASQTTAEMELRGLGSNRLPELERALSKAASDLQTIFGTLKTHSGSLQLSAADRLALNKLGASGRRVCMLYESAKNFHAGLTRIRANEVGGYDAQGELHAPSAGHPVLHCLETRG